MNTITESVQKTLDREVIDFTDLLAAAAVLLREVETCSTNEIEMKLAFAMRQNLSALSLLNNG